MKLPRRFLLVLSLFVFGCSIFVSSAVAQTTATGEWTWMGGDSTANAVGLAGVYGTRGVFSSSNAPGGRSGAIGWTDALGKLWLFGGEGVDAVGRTGFLNDLWAFDPTTGQWAWMAGSSSLPSSCTLCGPNGVYGTLRTPTADSVPGGRSGAASWIDKAGNLWLFGGQGEDELQNFGLLNDLWMFNTTTRQWTWMGGNSQVGSLGGQPGVYGSVGVTSNGSAPGGRNNHLTWVDPSGNLWLFGGTGVDSAGLIGALNDLWEFNTSDLQWTWRGGSNTNNSAGVYGQSGVAGSTNVPGSRYGAVGWTDSDGSVWIYGGFGIDSTGYSGDLNDLWMWTPSNGEWTWQGGSTTIPYAGLAPAGTPGQYGTIGVPDASNNPGSRVNAIGGTGTDGNLWLFGGNGYGSADKGTFNDLWVFNTVDNEWAWMGGSSTVAGTGNGVVGVYGTIRTGSATNIPGSRYGAVNWVDTDGNLWVFGGNGYDSTHQVAFLNDLWKLSPAAPAFAASFVLSASPNPVSIVTSGSGGNATSTVHSVVAGGFDSAISLSVGGAPEGMSVAFAPATITGAGASVLTITAGSGVSLGSYALTVTGISGNLTKTTSITVTVSGPTPTATPTFSPVPGIYQTEQTVTISDATAGATIYYTTDDTQPTTSSTIYTGPIAVSSSQTIAAIALADGLAASPIAVGTYTIGTPSAAGTWTWISGSNYFDSRGFYGILGTYRSDNLPPSRSDAAEWTDSTGNFWLFGGAYPNSLVGGFNDLWKYNPTANTWVWMSGSNQATCATPTLCGVGGTYGLLGTAAASNVPGGRWGAAHWTDQAGHLWLFGGHGLDATGAIAGELNDLWEFDPSTTEWTWMEGSDKGTIPTQGGYGQPGIYGTLGVPASGNIPGGRHGAASWIDGNGNFWLFGGIGEDAASDTVTLNDLWEYNVATGLWTWMGGSSYVNPAVGYQAGVYGTLGTPSTANVPSSRSGAAAWVGRDGDLWLFGGEGGEGNMNDLWRYNPATSEWTWMSGASTPYCPYDPLRLFDVCTSQPESLGTLGVAGSGNVPPGGSNFSAWTDSTGNFWLFGGTASDITGQDNGFHQGLLNSLWVYNPSSNQWAWMGGDSAASDCVFLWFTPIPYTHCAGNQGIYGTLMSTSSGSFPGARTGAVSWADKSGNLWLFSGRVNDPSNEIEATMNDLWEYQPSATTLPPAAAPIFNLTSGTYTSGGTLAMANGMANSRIYYTTDGSTPTLASTPYTAPITVDETLTVKAMTIASGYRHSGVTSATYSFPTTAATPVIFPASGIYTSGQTVTIADTTPDTSIYVTTDGSTPTTDSALYNGPFTVSSTKTIHAIAVVNGHFVYNDIAANYGPYVVSNVATSSYTINLPAAAAPTFSVPTGTYASAQSVSLSDATPGAAIYFTLDGATPTQNSTIYSAPITISSTTTVQAIAIASGYANSIVTSATYTLPSPAFSLSATPVSVAPGSSATSSITISSSNGYLGTITLSCKLTSWPVGATHLPTCSGGGTVTLTSVTPSATATVSVNTTAPTSASQISVLRKSSGWPALGSGTMLVLVLFSRLPKRRPWWSLYCAVVSASLFLMLTACGSGGSGGQQNTGNTGTSAGTYTFTVTGNGNDIAATQASTTFTLTVN